MMKKEKKLFLLWLFPAAVMCMIFAFSQMDAEASSDLSGGIVSRLLAFAGRHGDRLLSENESLFSALELCIRKTAHATEYALLGAALVIPFSYHVGLSGKRSAAAGIVCAALYACTDEFHQLFVSGRSGRLLDVGIDTVGACIGVLVCMLILKKLRKTPQVQHGGVDL